MKALIQRVSNASVLVENQVIGEIQQGLVIFLGITHTDTNRDAEVLAEKCVYLRIFEDENEKMNRSLLDINGEALIISQFTLYGDCRKGRRPNFIEAAKPHIAIPLYEHFVNNISSYGIKTATGEFGAMMSVNIKNEGPVTFLIDTSEIGKLRKT